jgi:hypothetical protein
MKGHKITLEGDQFLIRERKHPSPPTKPQYFLWNLSKSKYGSSLYPLGENRFSIEINGKYSIINLENSEETGGKQ